MEIKNFTAFFDYCKGAGEETPQRSTFETSSSPQTWHHSQHALFTAQPLLWRLLRHPTHSPPSSLPQHTCLSVSPPAASPPKSQHHPSPSQSPKPSSQSLWSLLPLITESHHPEHLRHLLRYSNTSPHPPPLFLPPHHAPPPQRHLHPRLSL